MENMGFVKIKGTLNRFSEKHVDKPCWNYFKCGI